MGFKLNIDHQKTHKNDFLVAGSRFLPVDVRPFSRLIGDFSRLIGDFARSGRVF